MKFIPYKSTLVWLLLIWCHTAPAQQTGQANGVTKIAKFKPPKVVSLLGINSNGASVTIEEANQLIALPLKVTDSAKNMYTVDTYHFLYKRKSVVEDERGTKQVSYTTVADRFDKTPLPKIWVENIQDKLQKSEELYFFDIIVKDKQGRRFFAPDLRLTIK